MDGSSLAKRLEDRFGLGGKPLLRKALYTRLADLVDADDEQRVYMVIAEVADAAKRAREPGKYFSFVVMRRLVERGIVPPPQYEI